MSADAVWFVANGQTPIGPMTFTSLREYLAKQGDPRLLVYGPETAGQWQEARHIAGLQQGAVVPLPPPVRPRTDVIDYTIYGEDTQFVEVELDPGEMVYSEAGALMYMDANIKMETVFNTPGEPQKDVVDQALHAGKRLVMGESLALTTYTNAGTTRERVAFAAPYLGRIIPLDLKQLGGEIICQKTSFLCAARGVSLALHFQNNVALGLFGGEGFVMQKVSGEGIALAHAGGMLTKKTLKPGELLRIDTGCVVAYTPGVKFDVEFMRDVKNVLFGAEGFALATLTGPGDVWLQSLPFSRLAGTILAAAFRNREEGSLLGPLSGLGPRGTLGAAGAAIGAIGALGRLL